MTNLSPGLIDAVAMLTQLRSTDLAPNSNEPSPIELPSSWSLTVEPPIAFRYDGVCTGGEVRLSFPAGERSYRLQSPYCRPEAM